MLAHTPPLQGRDIRHLALTGEEAIELWRRGFRFSVFRPGAEECRLSLPIETVVDFEASTLTIKQPEAGK